MKYTIFILILAVMSCNEKQIIKEENIEENVRTAWKGLYKNYENLDLSFIDYYQDDVIRMNADGEYKIGKDLFKEAWGDNLSKYHVEVLDYSEPTILPSKEQAVTYNTYKEIFVNKQTLDTTLIEGTWIGVWKKQDDGSWKVRMSTWHN